MNKPAPNPKSRRRISSKKVLGVVVYLGVIIALIVSLLSFKGSSPYIEEIRVNHSTSTLEITGRDLDVDIRASILKHDPGCTNVVADKFLWERVFDVKIKGNIAWALCRNVGLVALDISNPQQPQIVRVVHIEKFLWHLKIVDDTAYVACGKDGVVVCDISSPAEAKVLFRHKMPRHCTDTTSGHGLIYVSNGKHGISILDPETKSIINQISLPGVSLRIHVYQDKLFVLNQHKERGSLHIFEIGQNPGTPAFLQHLEFEGNPRDYMFKDNRLFLANGNGGIGVVDFRSGGEAHFTKSVSTYLRSDRLAQFDKYIVTFSRRGQFEVYLLHPDGRMELRHFATTCSPVFGVDLYGNYAVIAANEAGVNIVDLGTPPHSSDNNLIARLPARFESPSWKIKPSGAFVRDAEKLYYLQRLEDGTLKKTGELTYPDFEYLNAYNVVNSRIYAAIKGSGLHVGRILADGSLEHRKIITFPEHKRIRVNAIEAYADRLYLCTSTGLKVFDISDPDTPVYDEQEDIPGNIRSIAFGDGFAYISSYGHGIKIAPLKADSKLGPAGVIAFPEHLISGGENIDIVYKNGFLFAACGYRGVLSIDVRKPHNPVILDSIELSRYCKKVELKDGVLGGLSFNSAYLFDVTDPEHLRMLGTIENIEDFHLGNNEILGLQLQGIISTSFPIYLKQRQSSEERLAFQLPPADHLRERYNLFLNLNNKRSQLIGTLTSTPSGASSAGWEFTPHKGE